MAEIEHITFACTDADRLAEFWSAALDGERRGLPASLDSEIVDRSGEKADLLFKEQPKGAERDLPIHLDLSTDNREETVERLCELGGSARETKTETYETHTATWTVLEDPEGTASV